MVEAQDVFQSFKSLPSKHKSWVCLISISVELGGADLDSRAQKTGAEASEVQGHL